MDESASALTLEEGASKYQVSVTPRKSHEAAPTPGQGVQVDETGEQYQFRKHRRKLERNAPDSGNVLLGQSWALTHVVIEGSRYVVSPRLLVPLKTTQGGSAKGKQRCRLELEVNGIAAYQAVSTVGVEQRMAPEFEQATHALAVERAVSSASPLVAFSVRNALAVSPKNLDGHAPTHWLL